MTVLTFPSNPTPGQQYDAPNQIQYVYDGVKWIVETVSSTSDAVTNSIQDRVAPIFVNGPNQGINFAYNVGTNVMRASVTAVNGDRLVNGSRSFILESNGNITTPTFTIPNAVGTNGQVLKWPSSGSTLVWGSDSIFSPNGALILPSAGSIRFPDTSVQTTAYLGVPGLSTLAGVAITSPLLGQVLKYNGSNWINAADATAGGGGTVTSVSVASANGFAGSVATASSTPAITITTSITGVLKGNSTAISAATIGTDYAPGTSALTTGIVKSTTTTGALSIAVAGTDYQAPVSATGILKSSGVSGNVSAAVAGTDYQTPITLTTTGSSGAATFISNTLNIPQYVGGTGTVTSVSGTGTVSGLTLTGTVTSSGSLTLGGTLDMSAPPAIGGTTAAAGTFTTLRVNSAISLAGSTGSAGQILTSQGAGAPIWTTASGTGNVVGPATSTLYSIPLFDNSSGTLLKDSATSDGTINGITIGKGASSVSNNTAFGVSTLGLITTGSTNSAFGSNTLTANITGISNSAFGSSALGAVTANYNSGFGKDAGTLISTGTNNTVLGYNAGAAITTGSNNTIIGNINGITTLSTTVIIAAGFTERLRILTAGAWSIGATGTNYGTAGQVLTSGGSSAAPSWTSGGAATTFSGLTDAASSTLTVDKIYLPAITRLNVTANGTSSYSFDQYSTTNPTIYAISGTTISFNLDITGHPLLIRTSGAVNYDVGLVHVSTTGVVSTGSSAQGRESGTLYWKIPVGTTGNYQYICSIHGIMVGVITIKDISAI